MRDRRRIRVRTSDLALEFRSRANQRERAAAAFGQRAPGPDRKPDRAYGERARTPPRPVAPGQHDDVAPDNERPDHE